MSELKITPGPWEVERKDGDCVYGGRAGMELVCQTYNNENDAADARLIAAAPDLLKVAELGYELSSWTACINWRGGENQKEWLDDLRQKIEEFQPLAKAVIAKAKGE